MKVYMAKAGRIGLVGLLLVLSGCASLFFNLAPTPVNGEIRFAYRAPQAEAVYLVGSFNGWQVRVTPMERERGDIWTVTIALEPGRYEYMFVVDGKWVSDPNAPRTVDSGFGVKNGVIDVR
ncbi:MAG: glycogen-binding domain-containing protein [Candidatus Bipolaricaulia bacterium]